MKYTEIHSHTSDFLLCILFLCMLSNHSLQKFGIVEEFQQNAPENNWLEEVENKIIGDMNQLKHNGVDDEFIDSTHSSNVIIAMKKLMKSAKDPTI